MNSAAENAATSKFYLPLTSLGLIDRQKTGWVYRWLQRFIIPFLKLIRLSPMFVLTFLNWVPMIYVSMTHLICILITNSNTNHQSKILLNRRVSANKSL